MNVLLTGFEAFLDHKTNPTIEIVNALKSPNIDGMILPVEYEHAADQVNQHLDAHAYDAVILLGLAANRSKISIEHHAINLMDAKGPDNRGLIKRMEKIDHEGPEMVLTGLSFQSIIQHAEHEKRPIELSLSAGAYICNDVFYRVRMAHPELKVGFIHVPSEKTMPIESQIEHIQWVIHQIQTINA